jgi:hypothetical protein
MGPIGALFGVGDTSTPSPTASGNQALELLQGLINMQPEAFGTQATFGPQYTALTGEETGGAAGTLSSLLAQYLPGITSSISGANTAAAGSAVGDLSSLGAGAVSAINNANPAQASLLSNLTGTANTALEAGDTLAPSDATQITNAVQSNWASRGLGTSSPAQLDQALQLYTGGQNVLNQREQAAGTAAGLESSLVTNPALNLTQTQSTAPVAAGAILGQAGQIAGPSGDTLTDPTSILSAAYNANAAANITNANNAAALNSY